MGIPHSHNESSFSFAKPVAHDGDDRWPSSRLEETAENLQKQKIDEGMKAPKIGHAKGASRCAAQKHATACEGERERKMKRNEGGNEESWLKSGREGGREAGREEEREKERERVDLGFGWKVWRSGNNWALKSGCSVFYFWQKSGKRNP